jgi:hypothetical protein
MYGFKHGHMGNIGFFCESFEKATMTIQNSMLNQNSTDYLKKILYSFHGSSADF